MSPDASQENSQLVQSVGTFTGDLGGLEDVPILGQMIQAVQGIGNQLQAGYDYVFGAGVTSAASPTLTYSGPSIVTCHPSGCVDQNGAPFVVNNQEAAVGGPIQNFIRAVGVVCGICLGPDPGQTILNGGGGEGAGVTLEEEQRLPPPERKFLYKLGPN